MCILCTETNIVFYINYSSICKIKPPTKKKKKTGLLTGWQTIVSILWTGDLGIFIYHRDSSKKNNNNNLTREKGKWWVSDNIKNESQN